MPKRGTIWKSGMSKLLTYVVMLQNLHFFFSPCKFCLSSVSVCLSVSIHLLFLLIILYALTSEGKSTTPNYMQKSQNSYYCPLPCFPFIANLCYDIILIPISHAFLATNQQYIYSKKIYIIPERPKNIRTQENIDSHQKN